MDSTDDSISLLLSILEETKAALEQLRDTFSDLQLLLPFLASPLDKCSEEAI